MQNEKFNIQLAPIEVHNLLRFLNSATIQGKDAMSLAKLQANIESQITQKQSIPTVKEDATDGK